MKHQECSLCSTVPESCWEEYRSYTLISPPLPPAIHDFHEVELPPLKGVYEVSAMAFNRASMILLCCPLCQTYYLSEADKFNAANGPEESDIKVTRLSASNTAEAIAEVKEKAANPPILGVYR